MRDLINQMPVAGAQAKLCRKIDVDCLMPVGTATSQADGTVTFTVDMSGSFAGYISVQSEGSVPTLYFFYPDVDRDQTVMISLASPLANAGLLFQLGRTAAAGHGNVVISSQDCTGAPAAGVSYTTTSGDDMTAAFYTVGSLPTLKATETDSGGYGGLIGVPIGSATVSATLAKPHTDLGTISLLVQEGAITYTQVLPVAK
ncbi:MAG TPA: hypothetical protein VHU40_05365 [Polyangia bacterium]|nr:hypothetical protein [Polyangia bacterium]